MGVIAKVVVDINLDKEFDYAIPERFADVVTVGSRVMVPFGRRRLEGYVVGLAEESARQGLKDIAGVKSDKSYLTDRMLELVRWMADYYCVPLEQALRTILPSAVRKSGSGHKIRKYVVLRNSTEPLKALTSKQNSVVKALLDNDGMFLHQLTKQLGVTAAVVNALKNKGIVDVLDRSQERDPFQNKKILPDKPLKLMAEQAEALRVINEAVDKDGSLPVLLYGVTGSGKTEVYLQAISHTLDMGKRAIVLVPEIALTPQTVDRFFRRFGDRIAVLHSHLSDGERHDQWHRIRDGKADIVIGARSAVFAPVDNIGIIVVDEEHESSYKQEDAPRYNARDVAAMRGHMEGCAVVLGTATPSLESWNNATKGKYSLATLSKRVDGCKLPLVRVVDMRIETERTGHANVFSSALIEAIRSRLNLREQVILFLNRRGYSTSLVCPSCGHLESCGNCSVSYTYHRNIERLVCHICGSSHSVPQRCPGCSDPEFKFSGIGTQRVESIVKRCFPSARVQRMDADMTTKKDSYERILGDFKSHKTDILIGTQMIAKGLHFPNVTLVGVVYADLSLHMPDFRAAERTFQLLAQVSGRAGRGVVPGEVIVQTYTPHNPAVQAARRQDFLGFCDQEIAFRQELNYPPFSHLVCLTFRGEIEDKVIFCGATVSRKLKEKVAPSIMVSECAPAPLSKARGQFRYQVMMRAKSASAMVNPLRRILAEHKMVDGVHCVVDVDAINLL